MKKPRFLGDRIHGILDYALVLQFATAPAGLGIGGPSAILCYALAAIHLVMTALTDMPLGIVKLIPLRVHGAVELTLGLALIAAAWTFTDLLESGQLFFTLTGAIVFIVWVSSKYGDAEAREAA